MGLRFRDWGSGSRVRVTMSCVLFVYDPGATRQVIS